MQSQRLTDAEKRALLMTARAAIERHLRGGSVAPRTADRPEPSQRRGAFVSLYHGPDLRGCIGSFERAAPLGEAVADLAVAAATRDPRFSPVSAGEIDELSIELSVLSPVRRVGSPDEVVVGLHGIVVSRGERRGVLLPQVAADHGWTREEFLDNTCLKAGLPLSAWRDPRTTIDVFTAEVFGESFGAPTTLRS